MQPSDALVRGIAHTADKSVFEESWNAITKDQAFEFHNRDTGEYEYSPVRYDGRELSWRDVSVEVDYDYDVDWNLQNLADAIFEKYPELE